jgi:N-acetylmuramoyl-L-alanine amidase
MVDDVQIDFGDIDTLARTIFGEARGEPTIGKVAVASTVMNRVNRDLWNDGLPDWWGEGITGCCKRSGQFSCWLASDPNLEKIVHVKMDDLSFRECLAIAKLASLSLLVDPTHGATHYHAENILPEWARGKKPTVTLGRHVFYSNIEEG